MIAVRFHGFMKPIGSSLTALSNLPSLSSPPPTRSLNPTRKILPLNCRWFWNLVAPILATVKLRVSVDFFSRPPFFKILKYAIAATALFWYTVHLGLFASYCGFIGFMVILGLSHYLFRLFLEFWCWVSGNKDCVKLLWSPMVCFCRDGVS